MRQDSVPNHHQCFGKNTQQVTDSVLNQTINRAVFCGRYPRKGLTDSMMPTGRNSGSPLSLYRSTVMCSNVCTLKSWSSVKKKAAAHDPHIFLSGPRSRKFGNVTKNHSSHSHLDISPNTSSSQISIWVLTYLKGWWWVGAILECYICLTFSWNLGVKLYLSHLQISAIKKRFFYRKCCHSKRVAHEKV